MSLCVLHRLKAVAVLCEESKKNSRGCERNHDGGNGLGFRVACWCLTTMGLIQLVGIATFRLLKHDGILLRKVIAPGCLKKIPRNGQYFAWHLLEKGTSELPPWHSSFCVRSLKGEIRRVTSQLKNMSVYV